MKTKKIIKGIQAEITVGGIITIFDNKYRLNNTLEYRVVE